jgi:integrating conjugative element membrane protein (TIGR03747 family)
LSHELRINERHPHFSRAPGGFYPGPAGLILLALLDLTDSLVPFDIRRWSGGRDSAFVYHWTKKLIYPALITPWILYLTIPDSIHPNLIVLPFA